VNVGNHIPKLAVGGDGNTSERMFKEASSPPIANIDAFCVCIEEVGESLADVIFKP
jgi:hypothetical protein